MTRNLPFHSGELEIQARAGEAELARRNSVVVHDAVPAGARPFVKQQGMAILSSRDETGAMWSSIVFGRPGFLSVDDGKVLDIDLNHALVDEGDPVWANLGSGGKLGGLIIEPATRKRLRINGAARREPNGHILIEVAESYPACPKYITRRMIRVPAAEPLRSATVERADTGDFGLSVADAIFVATQSPEGGFDVSHRGGDPGFVKRTGPETIRWPEYPGNSMFNTLGNLVHDPHTGVAIPDFESRRVAQISGTAQLLWEVEDAAGESGGTGRFVEMRIEKWTERAMPAGLTTELIDYSPFNPPVVAR